MKSASRFALPLLGVLWVGCGDGHADQRAHSPAGASSASVAPAPSAGQSPAGSVGAAHTSRAVHAFNPARVLDLAGRSFNPFGKGRDKALVLIFICTDCPVANRYAPDLERLYEAYRRKGVAFYLIYADPREESVQIRRHLKDYGYQIAALRDPDHELVRRCGATKTPEAVLFSPDGRQVYRGRIDDRFTDYGKARGAPSREDLREAIDCTLQGKPVPTPTTEVVGCFIPEIRE